MAGLQTAALGPAGRSRTYLERFYRPLPYRPAPAGCSRLYQKNQVKSEINLNLIFLSALSIF